MAPTATGERDHMEETIDLAQLDQRSLAQCRRHLIWVGTERASPPARPSCLPSAFADTTLELALAGQQSRRVDPLGRRGGNFLGQAAQFRQEGGQYAVAWRARRGGPEAVGAVAFHPLPSAGG